MNIDIRYSRFDGRAVEDGYTPYGILNIQSILEKFENEFNQSKGYLDAFIKDDIGNVRISIECEDLDLKGRMYQHLKPYVQ